MHITVRGGSDPGTVGQTGFRPGTRAGRDATHSLGAWRANRSGGSLVSVEARPLAQLWKRIMWLVSAAREGQVMFCFVLLRNRGLQDKIGWIPTQWQHSMAGWLRGGEPGPGMDGSGASKKVQSAITPVFRFVDDVHMIEKCSGNS